MTQRLDALQAALEAALGARIAQFKRERGEITITVSAADSLAVAQAAARRRDARLRAADRCLRRRLLDVQGHAPWDGARFCVVTHLLSLTHNWRVRLKVFALDDDLPVVPSLTPVWNAGNWFEREAFDMFGIIFEGHDDLRRILTDYGFIGHPMRKDFPVTGHVEMRYDARAAPRGLPAGVDRDLARSRRA